MNLPHPATLSRRNLALAGLLTLLLPCLPVTALAEAFIEGSALFRERMALPPTAVFEAMLEDVSLADREATALGKVQIPAPGNPPIHFRIPYAGEHITPGRRYAVRATISVDGRLWFSTDQIYPVLDGKPEGPLNLLLRRVGGNHEASAAPPAPLPALAPATFTGDLPCADCPGIHYQVDLLPGGIFYRRMVYQERNLQVDSIGRWLVTGEVPRLALRDGSIQPERYTVKNASTLRMLDGEGHEITSGLNYDLKRAEFFQPIEPHGELTGLYRYMADAGRFNECVTGLSLPVAQEAANAQLEAAYGRAARKTPGHPLRVTVEGTLSQRPKIEGDGSETTLVVNRVIRVGPEIDCPKEMAPDFR